LSAQLGGVGYTWQDTVASRVILSLQLKSATKRIHTEAERTGYIAELLTGQPPLFKYCLLLRNLQPVYAALEQAIVTHAADLPQFTDAALRRREAIDHDLRNIVHSTQQSNLPLLAACDAYVSRVQYLSQHRPALLNAHAWVRYFGDLSGGQILARMLHSKYALEPEQLTFYQFHGIADIEACKDDIRSGLDANKNLIGMRPDLEQEAKRAFRYNIELSIEIAGSSQYGPTD
jgi:heme oxygenase